MNQFDKYKIYLSLLGHYYVILPYKVKRKRKIRFTTGRITADAKGATMADRIRMFWILLLENRSKNNIFRNKIINLSFNGLAFNTREHFASC